MTRPTATGLSLLRTALLATAAGLLPTLALAQTRVGVTSATDGDPLGKPPAANERVLRIGIDVQANELITTRTNDRAHLMFLDGTSLTVGPNAQLTIDRFVYDPNSKTGDLAVNASKGVFRLVGGRISKTNPITITTPSSTIGIRGGITLVDTEGQRTIATFVFGTNMTVTGAGRTETVTRPGSQVTTSLGAMPGRPVLVPPGALNGQLAQLEGRSGTRQGTPSSTSAPANIAAAAEQRVQTSGLSLQNSGAPPTSNDQRSLPTLGRGPDNLTDRTANALSNATDVQQQQQAIADARQATVGTRQTTGGDVGPTPTPSPTPPTTVLVSYGRFLREEPFVVGSFNNQTLAVTPNPQNNVALRSPSPTSNGQVVFTLNDGRSVTLPWQPTNIVFPVAVNDPAFGPLAGVGLVSPRSEYFAYLLFDSSNRRIGLVGGTPTTFAQFPKTGFAEHVLLNLSSFGTVPFASDSIGLNPDLAGNAAISTLKSAFSPNVALNVGDPLPNAQRAVALQATVSVAGQGSSQKSYMGVFIGQYFRDATTSSVALAGRYNGTYRLGADQPIGRLTSAASTIDTGVSNGIYGADASAMFLTPDSVTTTYTDNGTTVTGATTVRRPQASFDQPYTNLNGSPYYAVNGAVRIDSSDNPSQPGPRTDRTMNGFVGGLVEKQDSAGNITIRRIGGAGAEPGNVVVSTSASANRAAATFTVGNWDTGTSATFRLGGNTGASYATSAFIDDKNWAVADRPADQLNNTTSVTVGANTSTGADVQSRTVAVSSGAASLASFFAASGVTPCACNFMSWGVWGGDIRYNANSVYNPNGRDRLNLASFVVGTMTPLSQLPNTGSATYSGHAFGNVRNGAQSYVAAGTYTNSWNFASQTGAVTIGNFDGATYNGTTALTAGTVQFTGPIAGAGRTGSVSGAFFASPTDPAKGQGGSFGIHGPGYKAGGTFAGQRP
ncbi:MAG: FecR domain-containing protein [Reyranella sp.]|uniref:FecR domain-containing protein n=1 Tax=Reyranella sp. TaxID=1929291 RepID=UPI0026014E32|nr:FecR domain-containing protein [Reyranella sp.]MBR2819780.1 FecR domain-containing protein [Reyranella sp.]